MGYQPIELVPGARSFIVSTSGLMARYDMGEHTARKILRDWWKEQQEGGPLRVFRRSHKGTFAYYTTEATLFMWMPHGRDLKLVHKVEQLERELEFERRRVDKLRGDMAELKSSLVRIGSSRRS